MHVIPVLTPTTHSLPSQYFAPELPAHSASSPSLVTQRHNFQPFHIPAAVRSLPTHTKPRRQRVPPSLLLTKNSNSLRHSALEATLIFHKTSMTPPSQHDGRLNFHNLIRQAFALCRLPSAGALDQRSREKKHESARVPCRPGRHRTAIQICRHMCWLAPGFPLLRILLSLACSTSVMAARACSPSLFL